MSSVNKPATLTPSIDLHEVRTGNIFGAGAQFVHSISFNKLSIGTLTSNKEDEYTNRLVGQDPSVSPLLGCVELNDNFDNNVCSDKECYNSNNNNDGTKKKKMTMINLQMDSHTLPHVLNLLLPPTHTYHTIPMVESSL